jgi:hypothetical protein
MVSGLAEMVQALATSVLTAIEDVAVGDCLNFRVWLGMMERKEFPHGPPQSPCDP